MVCLFKTKTCYTNSDNYELVVTCINTGFLLSFMTVLLWDGSVVLVVLPCCLAGPIFTYISLLTEREGPDVCSLCLDYHGKSSLKKTALFYLFFYKSFNFYAFPPVFLCSNGWMTMRFGTLNNFVELNLLLFLLKYCGSQISTLKRCRCGSMCMQSHSHMHIHWQK